MRQLIPFVLEEEYNLISKELLGKGISITFEGNTRDSEALAVLARFVEGSEVKVRLVRFQLVKSSVGGDELSVLARPKRQGAAPFRVFFFAPCRFPPAPCHFPSALSSFKRF